jgi:iron complex outermembrane receptor protein/hemoglobin/transferrin/lactoferrin receptor protein
MSMPQALSYIPGVWMQKTNHGGGSAFVRGLTGYQTLLMVDGIRMNNSTNRSGPNQYLNTIDPLLISHVEVLRGSGSVQYGSDAIGGTIQLITKTPEFTSDGLKISGNIYGKYWSENMEKSTRTQVQVSSKKLAFLGGVTYKDFGDIRGGKGIGLQKPSGYDEYSVDLKGIFHLSPNHQLTGAYQHLKQSNVPLYHKIAPGDYSRYHFDPQQRNLAYLRLESFYKSRYISQIRYSLSYQNSMEVREKQKTGDPEYVEEEDQVKTLGASVDIISNISDNWNASTGLEYYHDNVYSKARSTNMETQEIWAMRGLYPDGSKYDNFAVFSMHNFEVNQWNLDAGLRYNMIRLQVKDTTFGNSTVRPDALVGHVSVVYKLNQKHHLSFMVNSSFRAPNINDVSSFGIADFRFEVPSYGLGPETSLNKEIGYKMRTEGFSVAFHAFHNKLNDLIANVPAEYNGLDSLNGYKVYRRENSNKAVLFGGELEVEGSIAESLLGYVNVAYTRGENISKNEPMRRIPPFNGRIGLKYQLGSPIAVRAEWIFAASQQRLSSGDISDDRIAVGGTPGWNVVNVYGSFEHRYFDINASFRNIFNESYRIHGSGIDGIGRSFWISLMINLNP